MKKHNYLSSIKPTEDQLLLSTIDAWISYSENELKRNAKSSPFVKWKCFACGKEIKVHYKHALCRTLYCDKCRPKFVKKTGIILRYMLMFKRYVGATLVKNSCQNLKELM